MAGPTINLIKTVPEFLKAHRGTKFKPKEIAQAIVAAYPAACATKKANSGFTSDEELLNQITREIYATGNRFMAKHTEFRVTEGKPRFFYWSDETEEEAVAQAEAPTPAPVANGATNGGATVSPAEADLYPKLREFLWADQQVRSMRVDEKASSNKQGPEGNHWLFPDLIGMEDLTEGWTKEFTEVVDLFQDRKARVWSFEVKVIINRSNLRESFFQAVSNSSWANFGYLVATEFSGKGIHGEMRMLSALHGIGFIKLNAESPEESEILFQARERLDVDWDSCNWLATENKDVRRFLQALRAFLLTGDANQKEWAMPVPSGP